LSIFNTGGVRQCKTSVPGRNPVGWKEVERGGKRWKEVEREQQRNSKGTVATTNNKGQWHTWHKRRAIGQRDSRYKLRFTKIFRRDFQLHVQRPTTKTTAVVSFRQTLGKTPQIF
jgi:hypothetical protein